LARSPMNELFSSFPTPQQSARSLSVNEDVVCRVKNPKMVPTESGTKSLMLVDELRSVVRLRRDVLDRNEPPPPSDEKLNVTLL